MKNTITVKATGEIRPTTDCPRAKEFAVFFNGKLVDYVVANSKKWALELADDRRADYICE